MRSDAAGEALTSFAGAAMMGRRRRSKSCLALVRFTSIRSGAFDPEPQSETTIAPECRDAVREIPVSVNQPSRHSHELHEMSRGRDFREPRRRGFGDDFGSDRGPSPYDSPPPRAPMGGGDLFQARARVLVPATVKLEYVRRDLEKIALDLMVDLKLNAER